MTTHTEDWLYTMHACDKHSSDEQMNVSVGVSLNHWNSIWRRMRWQHMCNGSIRVRTLILSWQQTLILKEQVHGWRWLMEVHVRTHIAMTRTCVDGVRCLTDDSWPNACIDWRMDGCRINDEILKTLYEATNESAQTRVTQKTHRILFDIFIWVFGTEWVEPHFWEIVLQHFSSPHSQISFWQRGRTWRERGDGCDSSSLSLSLSDPPSLPLSDSGSVDSSSSSVSDMVDTTGSIFSFDERRKGRDLVRGRIGLFLTSHCPLILSLFWKWLWDKGQDFIN